MSNYLMVWDPTNKKWLYALDGAATTDLIQNINLDAGSGASPSCRFRLTGETNPMGFYRYSEGNLALNIAGGQTHLLSASSGNAYFYVMSNRTGDTGTDWEGLRLSKTSGGAAEVRATSGATGTNRDLYIQTDGTNDIILRTAGANNRLIIDASAGGVTQVVSGAKATPGYGFISDVDTGLFLQAAGSMRVTIGGVDQGQPVTDHDTGVMYSGTNQSIAHATWTTLTYDGTTFDFDSSCNTGTGVFTFSESGVYVATAWCEFDGNATGERIIRFLKGTTGAEAYHRHVTTNASAHWISTAIIAYFNTGTYANLRVQVYQSSGGALNVAKAYFGCKKIAFATTKT